LSKTEVAFISKELTEKFFAQRFQRLAVVDIAGGEMDSQQLTDVVNNQMQLEAIKPRTRGTSPALVGVLSHG
jgi:hypothetical protein